MYVFNAFELLASGFLILLASFLAYWIYFKNYHYWADKNIPFENPIPFLGIFFGFFQGKSFHGLDQELYQKHGKLFGAYSGMQPYLFVADPELLKLVLVKDFNVFSSRRLFKTGIDLVDNMVSVINGDKWRNIRNTITPAFSSGKLKSMIPVISDCSKMSTTNFVNHAKEEKVVNCKKLFGNFTLDVIANIAFGTRLDSHNDPDNIFVAHASKLFSSKVNFSTIISFIFPKLAKIFGVSFLPLDTLEFFKDTTNSIIQRREKNNEVRPDFLQLMIDSQKVEEQILENDDHQSNETEGHKTHLEKVEQIKRKPLTKEEALSQCILFFIGGYDSTATTLSMASYYLALNPDVQEKAIDEVDRVWEKRDVLDSEAISEAKYLEAVIDETLRLCPPGVRIERTAEKDHVLGDTGIQIKKGMVIGIPVYSIHQDPEFYPEPEKFKPERFFPKEESKVKPYTYLPFGAGPRNCVAVRFAIMEVKICLLHILKQLKFSTCSETKIPMQYGKGSGLLQPDEVILSAKLRSSVF